VIIVCSLCCICVLYLFGWLIPWIKERSRRAV
jgi:hypothetical protein